MQRRKRLVEEISLNNFYNGDVDNINPDMNVLDQTHLLPFDSKWEFPKERLKLGTHHKLTQILYFNIWFELFVSASVEISNHVRPFVCLSILRIPAKWPDAFSLNLAHSFLAWTYESLLFLTRWVEGKEAVGKILRHGKMQCGTMNCIHNERFHSKLTYMCLAWN